MTARIEMEILDQQAFVATTAHDYLKHVEAQTGRTILFEPMAETAVSVGILSAFRRDPEHLVVQVAEAAVRAGEQLDHLLCHESTHGLLAYRDGYVYAKAKSDAPKGTVGRVSLMSTMVDDLAVNRIMAQAGLRGYLSSYIANVKKEASSTHSGNAVAEKLLGGSYLAKFKVYQYVTAWGCANLWRPTLPDRKVLAKYLKKFAEVHPQEHQEARQVVELVQEHGLDCAEHHRAVLAGVCDLWELTPHVDLKTDAATTDTATTDAATTDAATTDAATTDAATTDAATTDAATTDAATTDAATTDAESGDPGEKP